MRPKAWYWLLLVLVLVAGWQLGAGYEKGALSVGTEGLSGSGYVVQDPEKEVNIDLLWSVWRLLLRKYIDPKSMESSQMVFSAVEGLVSGVGDPYTVFMDPKATKAFYESLDGHLQGIGAELSFEKELVTIIAPLKGSPAERAGLLPKDVILEVNGESIDGLTLDEVVERIRGKAGTSVKLLVAREGKSEPLTFTIVREDIQVPSVEFEMLPTTKGQIAHLTLNQFGENSLEEVRKALDGIGNTPLKGIILDLRFNGGGYLDGAIDLTSIFLKQGTVVSVANREGPPEVHEVTGHVLFPDTPLVVLINESSASASEITAGALQDAGRATIIGKKSFGKGTVQEVIDLPSGSSLRVTVAHWLTPKGKNLGKEGVKPDIEVDRTAKDFEAKKDPQLEKAVEFLTDIKN